MICKLGGWSEEGYIDLSLKRGRERSKRGTHHMDEDLEQNTMDAQIRVQKQVALFLHQHGLSVYLREDTDGVPLQIIEPESE